MPLYFAYGSNMDRSAMGLRCPASSWIGPARLARHRFVIMREGYASVVRDPRREVWGVLWNLALADIPALDRYEGVASGLYAKLHQPVVTPEGPRRALIYVGRNWGPGTARPGYMEAVAAAAREAGLPGDYLRSLSEHLRRTIGVAQTRPAPRRVRPLWPTPFSRAGGENS